MAPAIFADAFRAAIEKFEAAKATAAKLQLIRQICTELTVHSMIEEEIFYPACKGKIEDDKLNVGLVEHDGAKVLIAELEAGSPDRDLIVSEGEDSGPRCRPA